MSAQCAGGDCLVRTPTGWEVDLWIPHPARGYLWVWVVLGITFALGWVTGYRTARWVDWIRSIHWPRLVPSAILTGSVINWQRLASRALAFVKKRRLVSFAFNNYKSFSLRNTEPSRPTTLRRRRLSHQSPRAGEYRELSPVRASGLTPLDKGPVTPPRGKDGSNRSGVERHRQSC